MGSCNSGDSIAEDHTNMYRTTCNKEEPQQKYCLGMVSNKLLGAGGYCSLHRLKVQPIINTSVFAISLFESINF